MRRFNRTRAKTAIARKLRRGKTDVERKLWQRLRNGQISDAWFRRQHPAGRYILDFYCPEVSLCVELDGSQHQVQSVRDSARDEWLQTKGVTILRFWNSDIIRSMDGVLEVIAIKIDELRLRRAPPIKRWSGSG